MICRFFEVLIFKCAATTYIYTYYHTRSLHVALSIAAADRTHQKADREHRRGVEQLCGAIAFRKESLGEIQRKRRIDVPVVPLDEIADRAAEDRRSEEHTSELQALMRISYAVLCLKTTHTTDITQQNQV